jgi:hypothetical protein
MIEIPKANILCRAQLELDRRLPNVGDLLVEPIRREIPNVRALPQTVPVEDVIQIIRVPTPRAASAATSATTRARCSRPSERR